MEPIVVYGATGVTGRLVAEELGKAGRTFVVAGRNREALETLSGNLPSRPEVRVADAADSAALAQMLGGMRAVVSTIGPSSRIGMPVVRAAVDLGVHYVDTTGEQTFQIEVYRELHRRAVSTGATVVTGAAFQSTFGYLGAALLHERCGPLFAVETYYSVDRFRPTAGTVESALAVAGDEASAFEGGRLVPLPTSTKPVRVRLAGETGELDAVAIPGGDSVMLPLDIPTLQSAACYALPPLHQSRALAVAMYLQPSLRRVLASGGGRWLGANIATWLGGSSAPLRESVEWKVFVRGQSPSGSHLFVARGTDVYRTSAVTASLTATWLADGRGRDAGVMTTGKALPAIELLDALKAYGVRWELR